MSAPRLVWYGDDFTGATDTLATLAGFGLRALLFLDVPSPERLAAAGPLDAIGVAGAARAMGPDEMATELAPVGAFFARSGARVLHYKCCSTFDSAPHVGSIGAALRALRPHAPNPLVSILGGQPSLGRYCVFGNLFARSGADGPAHRIDRHPTMARHPVTPMGEADLARHLAAQGLERMGRIEYPAYAAGVEALGRGLNAAAAGHPDGMLLDVSCPHDLAIIGPALWAAAEGAPLLAVGASSVAQALAAAWGAQAVGATPLGPAAGPVFVLAGSLSPVTRRQVEAARNYEKVCVDAGSLVGSDAYRDRVLAQVAALLGAGRNVLAVSAPQEGGTQSVTLEPTAVAASSARFVADLIARAPVRRLGVAGGDTSSQAVKALRPWALQHIATMPPGVAVCRARFDEPTLDGLELMLKGGQMGAETLFDDFVSG
ncbi:hypothetical protein GCM10007036_24170 [Alsobacter metallidurans]|uniref:Four-carbon acid sugar kinase family protein n=1 Tax=Alsobacter metallidurans TaxID=340221 RepID=A0A917I8G2_9HYPH|nr:four-carbon acid sugar kinase family protein [Alsobacter metallidurans]GGH20537.1 hypothetical protein GCM10007036_24170 [Alsobacter metallidurans]